jgi:hypothetical protein
VSARLEERSLGADPGVEFDRQVGNLLGKGYPELAGLDRETFRRRLAPLRERLPEPSDRDAATGIPFVVVVAGLVAPERAMATVELAGRRGYTEMAPDDLARFAPMAGLELPGGWAYLAVDVDTGRGTLNVTPDAALEAIARAGRSPLTIDEGIALLVHRPEVLRSMNCFSILGSRGGDRRVPAMWVSRGRPRLGWCWAGNPHSWLGSASCGRRIGA